jgi:hypothetical protein
MTNAAKALVPSTIPTRSTAARRRRWPDPLFYGHSPFLIQSTQRLGTFRRRYWSRPPNPLFYGHAKGTFSRILALAAVFFLESANRWDF